MEPPFKLKKVVLSLDCIQLVLNHIKCPKTVFYVVNLNRKTRSRFNESNGLLKKWRSLDLNGKMFEYAKLGDVEMVKFYVSKGADNFKGGLWGAAVGGSIELVNFFIDKGAKDIKSSLHFAIMAGQLEMVKYLFRFKLTKATHHKISVYLANAIGLGKLDIVKYIFSERICGIDMTPSMFYVVPKTKGVKKEDYQRVINYIKENERV